MRNYIGSESPHRGIFLIELMVVVACLAVLGSLISWGILAQIDTHRRLTIQANRQGVKRAVLRQLRLDMAAARASEVRPPVRNAVWPRVERGAELRLSTPQGPIRYWIETLVEESTAKAKGLPPNTTEPAQPLPQRVRRMDPSGDLYTWELHGQTLTLTAMPEAADRAVRVGFEDLLKFKTGHRRVRRFETTLITGEWARGRDSSLRSE